MFTTSSLDYEKRQEYKFTVYVTDDGTPAMTSNTTVTVRVYDANDNAPTFPISSYEGSVQEDGGVPSGGNLVYMVRVIIIIISLFVLEIQGTIVQ